VGAAPGSGRWVKRRGDRGWKEKVRRRIGEWKGKKGEGRRDGGEVRERYIYLVLD